MSDDGYHKDGAITQPFAFSAPEPSRRARRGDTLLAEKVAAMEKALDDAVKFLRDDGFGGTADALDDAWGMLRLAIRRESAR